MYYVTVPGTLDSNKGLTHINLCIPYIVLGCLSQRDGCPGYDTKQSDGEVPFEKGIKYDIYISKLSNLTQSHQERLFGLLFSANPRLDFQSIFF